MSTAKAIAKKGLFRGGLLFLSATLLGLFFATQSYLAYLYRGDNASFLASMSVTLPDWYAWALFTPVIIWLSRRFPLDRTSWVKSVPVYLGSGLLITFCKLFVVFGITDLISWLPTRQISIFYFHPNFLTYWVIIGLTHAYEYYRKFRTRELRNSKLKARLAQTQLQVLKIQLHPHFLFNTLHAISALMHRDVEEADRMMSQLSDLLRLTLENVGVQEVSLKKELDFLKGYLEIEKTRFQDRLTIHMEIEPETLDAQVPNLILQPLVENAVRHGIEPHSAKGKVEILAKRRNDMLEVKIRDNGPGMPKNEFKEGIGLSNTRARLKQLYGENFRFDLENGTPKGFVVHLTIPFKVIEINSNP